MEVVDQDLGFFESEEGDLGAELFDLFWGGHGGDGTEVGETTVGGFGGGEVEEIGFWCG